MVDTWVVSRVKSVQVVNINRKHFMMGLGQWDFTPNKVKVTNLISLLSIIVHIHIPMLECPRLWRITDLNLVVNKHDKRTMKTAIKIFSAFWLF